MCVRVSDAGAPIGFGGLGPTEVGCALNPSGIECDSARATAHVGDGDARARVSTVSTATIFGGAGDDDLAARGEGGSAIVYGGTGDDDVEADGEGGIADGGPGDDRVSAVWNVLLARGGAGDDEIHFWSQFEAGTVEGGPGDDSIEVFPLRNGTVTAGNGDDHVVISSLEPRGSGWTVDTGTGDDAVVAGPSLDVIDTGSGADSIDVSGGRADTVSCGKGRDSVHADAEDTIADDCEDVVLG
jgi:hypothetical protein